MVSARIKTRDSHVLAKLASEIVGDDPLHLNDIHRPLLDTGEWYYSRTSSSLSDRYICSSMHVNFGCPSGCPHVNDIG